MPKGVPLTEEEQTSRRRAIADASVQLFLTKGFPETSMREIAEAAGMGKSSLYDYFPTKDDILLFIIEDVTVALTERSRAIAGLDLPPAVRLRKIMETHLGYMEANNRLFWLLSTEAQRLKLESQRRIQERRWESQDVLRAIIAEGTAQGAFRAVDPLLTARILIYAVVSVMYTTRPSGSPATMLHEALDMLLNGIAIPGREP